MIASDIGSADVALPTSQSGESQRENKQEKPDVEAIGRATRCGHGFHASDWLPCGRPTVTRPQMHLGELDDGPDRTALDTD